MPPKFFITHSWKDIAFTRKLCDDLHAAGLDGFFDERSVRPGESIPSRIEHGLEECDVYIPVFSPDALKSKWCDWEINMAIMMNREGDRPHIIPVIAERCTIPARLRHLLYVNFVGRYDEALNELLTKGFGVAPKPLRRVEPPPPPPPSKSPERTATLLSGLVPVGIVVVLIVAACGLASFVASSLLNSPTPLPPTKVVASAPTTFMPTQTLTLTPKPTDTLRPTGTFTPKPTDTPRTTATNTLQPTDTPRMTSTPMPKSSPMMFIPAGEFVMGSSDTDKQASDNEKPQHKIYLNAFQIDKFEVTNTQYALCLNAGECKSPSSNASVGYQLGYFGLPITKNYPVIYISWFDANNYCKWVGRRLPTEAEWEKAARGIDGRTFPWGNTWDSDKLHLRGHTPPFGSPNDPAEVGSYSSGASPYGVLDMAGNVREWVADWYDAGYYSKTPYSNPSGSNSGQFKVVRGGSWDDSQDYQRVTSRLYSDPNSTNVLTGFRCAQ